jgi:hypothetical protein
MRKQGQTDKKVVTSQSIFLSDGISRQTKKESSLRPLRLCGEYSLAALREALAS